MLNVYVNISFFLIYFIGYKFSTFYLNSCCKKLTFYCKKLTKFNFFDSKC